MQCTQTTVPYQHFGCYVYVRVELHVTLKSYGRVSFYKIQALWSISSEHYEKLKHCFYMYLAVCGYMPDRLFSFLSSTKWIYDTLPLPSVAKIKTNEELFKTFLARQNKIVFLLLNFSGPIVILVNTQSLTSTWWPYFAWAGIVGVLFSFAASGRFLLGLPWPHSRRPSVRIVLNLWLGHRRYLGRPR